MAAATPTFVPGSAGTKEAHTASIPVSFSCPQHINPHTELPNPSPAFAYPWTKALIQVGTAGLIHGTVASLAYCHAGTAEAEGHQHSASFNQKPGGHPSPHSSEADTRLLSYYLQGVGCRPGNALQQHSDSFPSTPSHRCQPFVPSLLQNQFWMPSPFSLA